MTKTAFAVFAFALMVCGTVAGAGMVGATATETATTRVEAAAPTTISSCTVISEPGRYVLSSDVENSSADACIQIRASDVVLDGNGHAVDGTTDVDPEREAERFFSGRVPLRPETGIGVAVAGTRPLSNVTVTNLTLTDWRWGVVANRLSDGRISGVRTTGAAFGVAAFRSPGIEVTDSTAVENGVFGVGVLGGSRPTVENVNASGNGVMGVYLVQSENATVSGVTARDNDLSGVLLQSTAGADVTTTNASRSRYGVYLFFANDTRVTDSTANDGVIGVFVRNASNATVLNNTVLDNSFAGVYAENSTAIHVDDNRDGATTFESTGNETIGEEGGYSHDATIDVNQSDGLSDEELRAYVYRAIARAEHLRQLEYVGSLSLEVVSQAELERRRETAPEASPATVAWRNQLWEATFVVGEDRNATAVVGNESSRVAGFYNSFADRMVVVSEDDPLTVSSTTLVHEVVHALQDQHFDLTRSELQPRTEDGQRARSSLVEGDARYVEERFEQLCGVVWDCVQVESEEPPGGDVSPGRNFAVRQLILAPYSDGPNYVAQLRRQGGWEAVDDAYENPPNSTEQILHPEKRTEPPVPISFEDTARAGWQRFDQSNLSFAGRNGTTTIGEVGVFTMFWYQGYEYDNSIVGVQDHLFPNDPTFDLFDYESEPSVGWGNDVLVPYRNGDRFGYVWKTTWDTPRDAREFRRAYRQLLRGQGAETVGPDTWVIESGPFADAFRVVRDGRDVTIVNAPTVDALADVRPGLARRANATNTANATNAANATNTTTPANESR